MGCLVSTNSDLQLVTSNVQLECNNNNLQDCKNLFHLRELLNYYHKWMLQQLNKNNNKKIGIYEYISNNESYSVDILLNNYHHLINMHSIEFEEIYNFFTISDDIKSCNIETCHMLKRNHRDRSNNSHNDRNRSEIYYNHTDYNDVITQQFLDQIHCYIYHQFDTGFQLTKEDTTQIKCDNEIELKLAENETIITINDIKQDRQHEHISKIIQEKKNYIREIRTRVNARQRLLDVVDDLDTVKSKFMSNIINQPQNDATNDDKPMYSFGVRYYYDDKYKNNKTLDVEFNIGQTYSHWYISIKYKDLKEELLQNETESISKEQYNDLNIKAKHYKKTEHVLNNCKNITIDNLICLMIYCNFDGFQCEYTKTYRHELNETDTTLKKRHLEFGNMG
eukprot:279803_1